jgi:hypothetical protein
MKTTMQQLIGDLCDITYEALLLADQYGASPEDSETARYLHQELYKTKKEIKQLMADNNLRIESKQAL